MLRVCAILQNFSPLIFRATAQLAALLHPWKRSLIAQGDSFACRLAATRNQLGVRYLFPCIHKS
ncbi:hypothetical protein EpCFBP13511_05335 [Erwinia persicina]|uniref:Uncharacterized protein n=1 Tax=Erwinia persicina TaxID=55211 RepID=A0A4U3FJ09_9GAMM|nr:hypothetical protein EpCFBP13511_05335 [Erwinia persicina]